ncbi:MAG: hypothetical protein FLDDKLPJ_00584 [Phycisphaerae bacterium]|nr:hypothetical protein [Phycisphaerae bacterium]
MMARAWRESGEFRDELGFRAGRMPLYPAFVAWIGGEGVDPARVRAAQWIVGGLTAVLAASLGAALLGSRVGIGAGCLVAADPYLVHFSSLILTETLFIAMMLLTWRLVLNVRADASVGWREALVGAAAAAMIYVREAGLAFALALLISRAVVCRRDRRSWVRGALASAVIVLGLAPWAMYNHSRLDRWVLLTTRGGITLYDGVGPQADGSSDLGDVKRSAEVEAFALRGDEVGWDRHFKEAAVRCMRNDPLRVAHLAWEKLRRTWNIVPNLEEGRGGATLVVSAAWTSGVYALAAVGAWLLMRGRFGAGRLPSSTSAGSERPGRAIVVLLLTPAVVVTLMHAVLVGSIRYRLPAMPMLEVLAAYALCRIASRIGAEPSAKEIEAA